MTAVRGAGRAPLRRAATVVLCGLLPVAAVLTAPPGGQDSSALILHRLATLDDREVPAYLAAHPGDLLELLNSVPRQAAADWPRIPPADRAAVERKVPALVGNLDGLPYALRDRANRRSLTLQLDSARQAATAHPHDRAVVQQLAAYTAIHAALHARSTPARRLVELVPGTLPTAAIAIGDLDRAPSVTWVVPGMGTYTTDMQLWTLAAQNIWGAQRDAGAPAGHAVIAWIGYATPPVGLDAALGDYARNGAPELTEAIEGLTAVRRAHPPAVNVVAHSYGTTMAADALADTDLGIAAFVMLGSAGVEDRIASAADLHADLVAAGEAARDDEAALGRLSRADPRSPAFGARVFSVEGVPGAGLRPVTQHAPILHSPWNDDIASTAWTGVAASVRQAAFRAHLAQHGYLDAGTQSLKEVGVLTATTPVATPPPVRAPGPARRSAYELPRPSS
ncbi:alpha/beta hydrolase [Leifsonia aquatica]|uniref:alpha/beta hydrolase n=1 Tax=Leifsonia aquatica TaxID=144185 RepID=UPI00380E5747